MKTAGESNPHRYRLAVLRTHHDAKVWRQSAANERREPLLLFIFFLRKQQSCSMQAAIAASPGPARSLTPWKPPKSHSGWIMQEGSGLFLSLYLSVCLSLALSLSFPDTNHNCSCQNSPAGFRFTCWTSVNQMSTVFHPHSHTPSLERARGQKVEMTTGSLVRSIRWPSISSSSFSFQLYFPDIYAMFLNLNTL